MSENDGLALRAVPESVEMELSAATFDGAPWQAGGATGGRSLTRRRAMTAP